MIMQDEKSWCAIFSLWTGSQSGSSNPSLEASELGSSSLNPDPSKGQRTRNADVRVGSGGANVPPK